MTWLHPTYPSMTYPCYKKQLLKYLNATPHIFCYCITDMILTIHIIPNILHYSYQFTAIQILVPLKVDSLPNYFALNSRQWYNLQQSICFQFGVSCSKIENKVQIGFRVQNHIYCEVKVSNTLCLHVPNFLITLYKIVPGMGFMLTLIVYLGRCNFISLCRCKCSQCLLSTQYSLSSVWCMPTFMCSVYFSGLFIISFELNSFMQRGGSFLC